MAQALEGERGHIVPAYHRRLVESRDLDAFAFSEEGASLIGTESANILDRPAFPRDGIDTCGKPVVHDVFIAWFRESDL